MMVAMKNLDQPIGRTHDRYGEPTGGKPSVSYVTPESIRRGNEWLAAWRRFSGKQKAAWHALDRATKDASYKMTADELIQLIREKLN